MPQGYPASDASGTSGSATQRTRAAKQTNPRPYMSVSVRHDGTRMVGVNGGRIEPRSGKLRRLVSYVGDRYGEVRRFNRLDNTAMREKGETTETKPQATGLSHRALSWGSVNYLASTDCAGS
jgi:hypothetical protein